jgi:uncharacterized membrane protein
MAQHRLNFGNIGWRGQLGLVLATAVGLAAAVALVILSLGLLVIVLPLVAIGVVVGRWRLRKMMDAAAAQQKAASPQTIEIDYRVIDGEDRGRR